MFIVCTNLILVKLCDLCYTLVSKNVFVKCVLFNRTHLWSLVSVRVVSDVQLRALCFVQ
jgi:hypothetical protein